MIIKQCPLTFHNVLSAKARCKMNEWHVLASQMRNSVIMNGLYGTGPVIYQTENIDRENNEADFTFHIPVNKPIEMKDNDKYSFIETLSIQDGLVLRHADMEESIEDSYQILKHCAEEYQITLQEPFYNIYLDVYGDGMIDIFAPIVKEEKNND